MKNVLLDFEDEKLHKMCKTKFVVTDKGLDCLFVSDPETCSHTIDAYVEDEGKAVRAGALTYGYTTEDLNVIYLTFLSVAEKYQNQGIGSKLLQEFVRTSRKRGYDVIKITGFTSSREFFEKNGFEVTNVSKNIVELEKQLYYINSKLEKSHL